MSATRSQAAINKWIRKQEARLGIGNTGKPASKPASTMTVRLILIDSEYARLTRAHLGADALISHDDLSYELPPLSDMQATPRRTERVRHIRTND